MSDHEPQMTVIGPDTRIKGEMTFDRTALVLGTLEGAVTTAGELQIGSTAQCRASLEAGSLIIDGAVEGDVIGRERVQLNGSARVDGDIVAEKLIVAEGASFNGHCRVGAEATASAQPAAGAAGATEAKTSMPPQGPKLDWVGQSPTPTEAAPAWGPSTSARASGGAA